MITPTFMQDDFRKNGKFNRSGWMVLGPETIDEVKESLSILEEGLLEKELFDRVTEVLLKSID